MPIERTDRLELQKILQIGQIDVGNETLFSKRDKLQVSRDHLTLVISSGGSGAAAIREAVRTAKQKLVPDYSTYMKFIMIDSDGKEVTRTTNVIGRSDIEILNISTPGAPERLRHENRGDFFKKFVPEQYDYSKLGPDGAGKDRMTGKIKFYDNAESGNTNDVKFRNIIKSIFSEDWSDKNNLPVDIMILAGLSGGNGSGTFEEIAVHAREACRTAGSSAVRVFGYLFLPDTMEAIFRNNQDDLNAIYSNGYAALKELESYMSIPASPGRSEKFFSRDGVTIECNNDKRLFDYPVLISGTYDESKSMMAESIINLSIESDATFSQSSFYSNSAKNRAAYLNGNSLTIGGMLKGDVFPEDSRRYCGIGYAYAAIPDQIVTANVVSNVCQKLYKGSEETQTGETAICFCTEENRMSKSEMETQVRRLFGFEKKEELNSMSFWLQYLNGKLDSSSRLNDNQFPITKRDVIAGNTKTYEQGFNATTRVADGYEEFKNYLKQQAEDFKKNAVQVIKDYGPKAMELLYKGSGPYKDGVPQSYPDISIENMLNTAREELQKVRSKTIARPELTPQFLEFITRAGLTQWKGDFKSAIQHEVKQKIIEKILEPDGAWEKQLINPIKDFINQCKRFADSLETLSNFYKSAGSSLDAQSYEQFRDASQTGNCVNLCDNANVYGWVKENIQRKINAIHLNDVKQNIVNSFIENTVDWVSDVEGKTRKVFDEVMAKSCELGSGAGGTTSITLTATSYFDYVLKQEPQENVASKARELVQGIVRRLSEKSKPALKRVQEAWSITNKFILLPQELEGSQFADPIKKAFADELKDIGDSSTNGLSISSAVSDIVCYQTSVANALCDLVDIGRWEECYNETNDIISRHLCNGEYITKYTERTKNEIEEDKAKKAEESVQRLPLTAKEEILFGTGLSWEHYPPVALRRLEENTKEQEFLSTIFNPIVEYAMKEKLIERKINSAVSSDIYEYVVHLIPDDWKKLNVEDYEEIGPDGRFERGEKLFNYLKNQNPISVKQDQKQITLFDSGIFANPFDFSAARQNRKSKPQIEAQSIIYMKRILRKNTELFLELRETLCRYYDIVKILEFREKDQKYKYQVDKFIRYYQYGVVYSEGDAVWRYMINNKGNTRTLCKFDAVTRRDYSSIEKKLAQKNWEILIAFKDFTGLNFDELDSIVKEKQESGDRNELNTLLEQKGEELRNLERRLKRDFIDPAGEDRTPEEAIRSCLRKINGNDDEEFYVKTLVNMYESLEEFTSFIEPVPEPVPESEEWDCSCGHHNLAGVKFCAECGRAKEPEPVPEPEGWDCSCGYHNLAGVKFCSECGKAKPEEGWDCSCGHHNLTGVKFCAECGRAKGAEPVPEPEEWDCSCGHHNLAGVKFCAECGRAKGAEPVPEPEGWDCSCGHHNLAGVKFCAECGKAKPGKGWDCSCGHHNLAGVKFCAECGRANEPVPEPEEWDCSCGHHNLAGVKFCAECGKKRN